MSGKRSRSGIPDNNNKNNNNSKTVLKPKFAGASHNVFDASANFVFRDNSSCLVELSSSNQALFLRPTQMGKTSLLTLANMIYNKKNTIQLHPAVQFQPPDAKSMFVLGIDFLRVDTTTAVGNDDDARVVDVGVRNCVASSVNNFLLNYPELRDHYREPRDTDADAGVYLEAAAEAVANYGLSESVREKQSLLVLVDEYERLRALSTCVAQPRRAVHRREVALGRVEVHGVGLVGQR